MALQEQVWSSLNALSTDVASKGAAQRADMLPGLVSTGLGQVLEQLQQGLELLAGRVSSASDDIGSRVAAAEAAAAAAAEAAAAAARVAESAAPSAALQVSTRQS